MILQNINQFCFELSYLTAFLCELARMYRPSLLVRSAGLSFGIAGLTAHSLFLALHPATPAEPTEAMLIVAWALAVFYLVGALHHSNQNQTHPTQPVVIALSLPSFLKPPNSEPQRWMIGGNILGELHGFCLLFAAVGAGVGFLASLMYLIQTRRLRNKLNPIGGMRILSLERLESMNRRAVNLAVPFLTLGLFLGLFLIKEIHDLPANWYSLKILGTLGLWVVFLVLFYLRHATHLPGRRLALLTIAAFLLMLGTLAASHPFLAPAAGGSP